ncbi:uncharacterized protein [Amphiura filiformis]|uniref:uncharacterized protein n=1 Tax=Amphiura filiformis TaxID=82378 RepID=UPI003B21152E
MEHNVAAIVASSSSEEVTSSWPLTFTILSTDVTRSPPVFWGQLKVEDPDVLPINICGGWEIEVTFNQNVTIISNPASGYKDGKSTPTVHYFKNKDYDSVYVIESLGDKYINIEGDTADVDTLNATAVLEENYHPPVTACDNGTTYTITAPRWSGGSNLGGFSALVQVPVVEPISNGWRIEMRFSEPLALFTLANVVIDISSDNKVFTLSNCCHWNAVYAVGETIDLPITVKYDTAYCPSYCAEFASTQNSTVSPTLAWPLTSTSSPSSSTQSVTISPISSSTQTSISSSSMTSHRQQQDSYFNRWQTIVIAVGPSSLAAILLSCILFVYYCVLTTEEKDDENERLELSESGSGIEALVVHGISNRESSNIAIPTIA